MRISGDGYLSLENLEFNPNIFSDATGYRPNTRKGESEGGMITFEVQE